MSFDPVALARSLFDAGGWTACIVVVVLVAFGLYSGRLVFGWQYREKVDDVKELTKSVARLTAELARERRRKDPPHGPG